MEESSLVSVPGESLYHTGRNHQEVPEFPHLHSVSVVSFLLDRVRGQRSSAEVRGHQGPSGTAHFLFRTWTTSLLSVRKFPKASASLLSSVAENKKGTKDFSLIIYMILFCIFASFCFFTVFSHRCDRCHPCRCPPPPPPRQGYHGSWWGHWARRCQLPLWTGSQTAIQQ